MKTDICVLTSNTSTFRSIFNEVEKSAKYNNLEKKQALQLRLLAEELVGMLPELLEIGSGEFWIENNMKDFELHATIKAERRLTPVVKETILSVSKSGKNAASKGIVNKIKLIAESMLDGYSDASQAFAYYDFYDMGTGINPGYCESWSNAWSLNSYKQYEGENKGEEEWDELEKSIIANLADDVIVGVVGKKVDILIKKKFD